MGTFCAVSPETLSGKQEKARKRNELIFNILFQSRKGPGLLPTVTTRNFCDKCQFNNFAVNRFASWVIKGKNQSTLQSSNDSSEIP